MKVKVPGRSFVDESYVKKFRERVAKL